MMAVVADLRQDIAGFLKIGHFSEASREGDLRFYTSRSIPSVVASTGEFCQDKAAQSVGALISRFNPSIIVSAGFASAARPNLPTGEIVVCDRVMAVEGPAYTWRNADRLEIETNPSIIDDIQRQMSVEDVQYQVGACVTLSQSVINSPMKEWLGSSFDVSAIDMESYWVADAVTRMRLPCLPVKVVTDTLGQKGSPLLIETRKYAPARRMLRSAGYIVGNPVRIVEVARLSAQVGHARKSLSQFLYRLARTQLAIGQR